MLDNDILRISVVDILYIPQPDTLLNHGKTVAEDRKRIEFGNSAATTNMPLNASRELG